MARIPIVTPEQAEGPQREIFSNVEKQYGYVPGIFKILLTDLDVAGPVGAVYGHLNLRPNSPLTRLEREMLATVVNGLVGGAP